MPRTEVYQLRLTQNEKGELARQASAEGISIATMIRRRFGLSAPPAPKVNAAPPSEFEKRVQALIHLMPRSNAERIVRKSLGS